MHELAVEDARQGHQRPKIEEYGQSLFVVLQMIENAGDELNVGEVDIFVGSNYVLSVRSRAKRGFTDVRERDAKRSRSCCVMAPPTYSMPSWMQWWIVIFRSSILSKRNWKTSKNGSLPIRPMRANIEALYGLKQKLMILKHAAEPLLDATSKLFGGRVPSLCVGLQDYFRDVYDHLLRLNQSIDSMRDMLTTAITVNLSLITLQESEVTKRLAAYAALVAVPTMIVGVYGMNFEHMPELRWEYGYFAVMAVMALIDGYLFYRFRKARVALVTVS